MTLFECNCSLLTSCAAGLTFMTACDSDKIRSRVYPPAVHYTHGNNLSGVNVVSSDLNKTSPKNNFSSTQNGFGCGHPSNKSELHLLQSNNSNFLMDVVFVIISLLTFTRELRNSRHPLVSTALSLREYLYPELNIWLCTKGS